jgi:hypothetical protein
MVVRSDGSYQTPGSERAKSISGEKPLPRRRPVRLIAIPIIMAL